MNKLDSTDRIFLLFLLILLIVLSYLNANIPFVYDDNGQIAQNPNIRDIFNIENFLNDPLRPNRLIQNFTFALNFAISGIQTWSYHYFNNALHFANTLLLYFIFSKIGLNNKFIKVLTCIIFFSHPLQVEGVTYIMARVELLKTFSTLILLHLYLAETRKKLLIYTVLSVSLLAKETCMLTPLLFIALDLTVLDKDKRGTFREHLLYFSHIVWVIPISFIIAGTAYKGTTGFDLFPFVDYTLTNLHYLSYYIFLFLNPSEQSLYHEWISSPPLYSVTLGALIYLVTIWFLIMKSRQKPIVSFFLVFFLVSFTPNNTILQFINPFAEYRLYQSNITLSFFMALVIWSIKAKMKIRKVIASLFVVYFWFFHYLYLSTWNNPLTIWGYAVSSYPNSFMANLGIGWEYISQRFCLSGLHHMRKACDGNQRVVFKHKCQNGLGMVYVFLGEKEKGFNYLHQLLLEPNRQQHSLQYKIYLQLAQELKYENYYSAALAKAKRDYPNIFANEKYQPDAPVEKLDFVCMNPEDEKKLMKHDFELKNP